MGKSSAVIYCTWPNNDFPEWINKVIYVYFAANPFLQFLDDLFLNCKSFYVDFKYPTFINITSGKTIENSVHYL